MVVRVHVALAVPQLRGALVVRVAQVHRHLTGGQRAHIFLGAKKENRLCLPNTRFLLHQPAGGMRGQASDIQIEAEQIIKMRDRVNRMIAKETGQTVERIVKDTQRNFWMSAEEAVDYGIVSRIINNTSEV